MGTVFNQIDTNFRQHRPQLAVLIDPDKVNSLQLPDVGKQAQNMGIDYFLVGGSLLTSGKFENTIDVLKQNTSIPVIIFPGSYMQIYENADAILFLSLISGRNAEFLIGNQVIAAPSIKEKKLEAISTGYMIVDSGKPTSASYMSHSFPIPSDKPDIAVAHALAAEYLGMKQVYLEGGSGASESVDLEMISAVRNQCNIPIWVGGGIRKPEIANQKVKAGASVVVIGTHFESVNGYHTAENFATAIKSESLP